MSSLSLRRGLLDGLHRVIHSSATQVELTQSLRALQRSGLRQADLRVHIERIRAANDATQNDEHIELQALTALDIVTSGHHGLSWDPPTLAGDAVYRLHRDLPIEGSMERALAPSDLLPISSARPISGRQALALGRQFRQRILSEGNYQPTPAHFVRVPKREFTSRPAAVMSLGDRIVLESLADLVVEDLDRLLPEAALWPRLNVDSKRSFLQFQTTGEEWKTSHTAAADIENFYEYVDHSILARVARDFLGMSQDYCSALEALLDTVMESPRGLPQGPVASETFAALYLLPLDLTASQAGWRFVRYQDDYLIGADSYEDARELLRQFEAALREFGLRLSAQKTSIQTRKTVIARKLKTTVAVYSASSAELRIEESEALPGAASHAFEEHMAKLSSRRDWESYLLLRESLAACSRTGDMAVPFSSLGRALDWFPQLMPDVAHFLARKRHSHQVEVDTFLSLRIKSAPAADWENAWLCRVPEIGATPLSDSLAQLFDGLARDIDATPMTRFNAYCGLFRADRAPVDLAPILRTTLPPAFWAELNLELWPGPRMLLPGPE